jgi:hypothetical protein
MDRRNVKNIRIIRRLLDDPHRKWTKYGLAKASGCSRQWVIQFLRSLEGRNVVKGTRVRSVLGLAKLGAGMLPEPMNVANMYHPDPVRLLGRLGEDYAVTTYFGENQLTHHLFLTRYDAYVTEEAFRAAREAVSKEGLIGGGNLRLMIPVDDMIIKEASNIRGVRVVSVGQLMLDLVKEGGVAMQAAEEMVKRNVRQG